MSNKIFCFLVAGCLVFSSAVLASEGDDSSAEGQALRPSFGTQAGETARELKDTAGENYAVASAKVSETSQKVQAEAQDAFQNLQQQWNELSLKLQESFQQLSQQVQKQWADFNQSFNQPKQ